MRKLRKQPNLDEHAALREEIEALQKSLASRDLELTSAHLQIRSLSEELRLAQTVGRVGGSPMYSDRRSPRIPPHGGLRILIEFSRGAGYDSQFVEDIVAIERLARSQPQSIPEEIGRRAYQMMHEMMSTPPRLGERGPFPMSWRP